MAYLLICSLILLFQQVDAANPPFPRPVAHWWYGCRNVQATFSSLGRVLSSETSVTVADDIDNLEFDAGEWNRPDWKL